MLSLETVDDWTAAAVTITVGGVPETYTHTGGSPSAYHLAKAATDWANDAGRAWHGAASFDWSWQKATNGGASISFTTAGSGAVVWTPNAAWSAVMGHTTQTATI